MGSSQTWRTMAAGARYGTRAHTQSEETCTSGRNSSLAPTAMAEGLEGPRRRVARRPVRSGDCWTSRRRAGQTSSRRLACVMRAPPLERPCPQKFGTWTHHWPPTIDTFSPLVAHDRRRHPSPSPASVSAPDARADAYASPGQEQHARPSPASATARPSTAPWCARNLPGRLRQSLPHALPRTSNPARLPLDQCRLHVTIFCKPESPTAPRIGEVKCAAFPRP